MIRGVPRLAARDMTTHLAKFMPLAGRITLRRSGKFFTVDRDETILEAALRHEIWLPHACRGGTCGSCRATVVAGAVTYGPAAAALMRQPTSGTQAFLCCAQPLGDVTLDVAELAARPIATLFRRPARVTEIARASRDVAIVTLKPPPTATIRFRPGQYILVVGQDGRLHPFSIANAPRGDGSLELHIGRVADGCFTRYVHEQLRLRDILRFEGPFGEFGFSAAIERPAILVAGGTGIAPIKAMLESLSQTANERALHLYWGSRHKEGLYAIEQIRALRGAHLIPVLSEPKEPDGWLGRTGLVHRAVLEDFPDLSCFDVYACGSPGLIEAALSDFTHLAGLPRERFFAESFNHAGTAPHLARDAD
jgi:CDP-4-dehydro-6-deoxyglucose reductase, E3